MSPSARRVAYDLLRRIDDGGAFANLVTPAALDASELELADRRLVTDLVYGTTRMRRACDAAIDRFVAAPPDPAARTLLRLGAYQILFTGIPDHAAVSETVGLAPRRIRGFVNAVLRRVASTPPIWPSDASRLSYPDWIVERLIEELGHDDGIAALERMNQPPPVERRDDGYVQDRSSQWVAAAVEATADELVLDLCAAPGGKATAIAATGASVVAADVRIARAGLIRQAADRTGTSVNVVAADGTAPPFPAATFDAVLIDAPCSGLGALRRRADARWRITPTDVDQLVWLQRELLASTAPLVRPGGRLVYSVCTLTAAESIDHAWPAGFEPDPRPPAGNWRPYGAGWRVLPHDDDTDGMVLLRYRRAA